MSILTYVTTISIDTLVNLAPLGQPINVAYTLSTNGVTIGQRATETLSKAVSVVSNFGTVFSNVWDFFLNNFLTPFMVISLIALFFIVQYYLLRLYYVIFKYFIGRAMVLYGFIVKSSWFDELRRKFDVVFSD